MPNVGKSTLFNALLQKQVANVSAYPFCTIKPNVGIVEVPDERLAILGKLTGISPLIPAVVEFVDIAGLVKGAHQGEGLGNQFLASIRESSLVCHLVRFFKNESVAHMGGEIDPAEDIKTVNTELILADLQTLDKQKEPRGKVDKKEQLFWEAVLFLRGELNRGKLAVQVDLTGEQKELVEPLFLLTLKPVIYAANVGEEEIKKGEEALLEDFPYKPALALSAKMEADLMALTRQEQAEYLADLNLSESGLNRLIKQAYEILGLITFFTLKGGKEIRAWTIPRRTPALQAAGVVHTDFEKNFIRAQVVGYQDFIKLGGWDKAKGAGKVRTEGKGYEVQDGEIIEFRANP